MLILYKIQNKLDKEPMKIVVTYILNGNNKLLS
jgi:hypothetical protein